MLTSDLLPQHLNLAFFETGILMGLKLVNGLAGQQTLGLCLSSHCSGYMCESPRPGFYVSSCGLNSGHYVCMAMLSDGVMSPAP